MMIGGAFFVLFSLAMFVFPACCLAGIGSIRLMRVYKYNQIPNTTNCCCRPSLPCIQTLLWIGFTASSIGTIFLICKCILSSYNLFILILTTFPLNHLTASNTDLASKSSFVFSSQAYGEMLMSASSITLFIAALLASVAGGCCCGHGQVGNLPGIGRSRVNCCCPELSLYTPNREN